MSDATLPLTDGEYEEWGNPADASAYARIRAYAPYENVRPARYPHLLVTAGLNDPRVSYWEPAKWVARLRRMNQGTGMLLLKVNLGAGHFGVSGRYEKYQETAIEYAFLIKALGAPYEPLAAAD
jgi:oligopeptidase B